MISFDISDNFFLKKTQILEALRTVIDPELQVNIVDLGLVYNIKISHTLVTVVMTLSSRYCPMGESILSATKNCVERVFPEFTAQADLVWEPEWNYDFISEEGIIMLGRNQI